MLGPPIDAWYVWLGVAAFSLAVLGVTVVATPEPPSTATAAVETVEQVSASRPPASGTHPIDADRVRIGEYRLSIDGDETATVDHGRMTPAPHGSDLRRVALGASPSAVFDSETAFRAAANESRSAEHVVEPAGDELIVRTVRYGGSDVTLVTA